MQNKSFKEFLPTSWSIDNRTSIYIITIIICIFGISIYNSLPKTQFPDIVIPTIYVSTVYPGTSPADMENLVSRPIEKEIKSISGVKKITSNSIQDFSNVIVEFNTDVDVAEAKQKVKDAVDKARSELPQDLPTEPNVLEIDFSEIPMMNINISGDFDLNKLKKYADEIKDRIEQLPEITRVDMVGALEREIQVNVDMYKMQAANVNFGDIESAIAYENMTISGGTVDVGNMKRAIRVKGQFKNANALPNIIVRSGQGGTLYLKDIADIKDTYKEQESYARFNGKNVITLNVIKRSGENLVAASDKINGLLAEMKENKLPAQLTLDITADQADETRTTLNDLINSIIIGFILVTLVLMFFMGVTNAFFVASAVPLSIFLAFIAMPAIGFELNMIVLFALLFALGIIVDDAIVVIENTYRIYDNGKVPVVEAAKRAAGEIFVPVFAGTLTTLAPFIPLAFWQGIIGKFMFYLPITLILTLVASLIVAFIINPVFAVTFMQKEDHDGNVSKTPWRRILIWSGVLLVIAAVGQYFDSPFVRNLMLVFIGLIFLYHLVLKYAIEGFEYKLLPKLMDFYEASVGRLMKSWGPYAVFVGTVLLLVASVVLVFKKPPPVVFFPQGDPNFIFVYLNLPVGTHQAYTDSITQVIESRVTNILGEDNPLVESVISNVAVGASDPMSGDRSSASNRGKVSIGFVKFAERNGQSTAAYLDEIRKKVKDIPGVQVSVAQEQNGPPTGAPINIEISGEDLDELVQASMDLEAYLEDSLQIAGIEELKTDFVNSSPEVIVAVDRERASRLGVSTALIGNTIRTAVFGKEVSKLKDNEDEYPIELRYKNDQRNDLNSLLNLKITFRDVNGQLKQIPLSAVADIKYSNTYGGIKRKNLKRVITLSSNVLSGYTANAVNDEIKAAVAGYKFPQGIDVDLTGEQEEQAETASFLMKSLLISLGLIFLILVTQFNSISRTLIILSEIIFSVIGVLLGFILTGKTISVIMTGIGIVGLAGIVVKNGILIVEFADGLRAQGHDLWHSVVQAGKIRLKPVLLTAISTVLGLIPLAIGLNINFYTLFSNFDPQIFIGGDSVVFWGPLSWTIIYGLLFATFLTLVVVPAMYIISEELGPNLRKLGNKLLVFFRKVWKKKRHSLQ
ncbi:MAG: efflux RND transporter permease subunit [Chitinophagales bacterium]|nr:efflux RND transporter permease subunit [Bacteroidota bacterium]MCB9042442.1 efflux RND transporter permease subunit [Chitinophagales bacterium]